MRDVGDDVADCADAHGLEELVVVGDAREHDHGGAGVFGDDRRRRADPPTQEVDADQADVGSRGDVDDVVRAPHCACDTNPIVFESKPNPLAYRNVVFRDDGPRTTELRPRRGDFPFAVDGAHSPAFRWGTSFHVVSCVIARA